MSRRTIFSVPKALRPDGQVYIKRILPPPSVGSSIFLMVFGCLPIGVGVMICLAAAGYFESEKHTSNAVLFGFGYLFVGAGLIVLLRGLVQLPAGRRNRSAPEWEHRQCWTDRRVDQINPPSVARCLYGTGVVAGFFTPFTMFFAGLSDSDKDGVWIFWVLAVVFGGALAYGWLRALKYKPSWLILDSTPLQPRSPMRFELHTESSPDMPKGLTAKLMFVSQRQVRTGTGKQRSTTTVSRALYTHEIELESAQCPQGPLSAPLSMAIATTPWVKPDDPEKPIRKSNPATDTLVFDLPDNPEWKTTFQAKHARFWALEVHAKTPGVDYRCWFILPIYRIDENTD